jgi:hypothetical protein
MNTISCSSRPENNPREWTNSDRDTVLRHSTELIAPKDYLDRYYRLSERIVHSGPSFNAVALTSDIAGVLSIEVTRNPVTPDSKPTVFSYSIATTPGGLETLIESTRQKYPDMDGRDIVDHLSGASEHFRRFTPDKLGLADRFKGWLAPSRKHLGL